MLSFEFLKKGARAYIAVSGGIDVPVVLGSRSTYALGALGGFKGRKLEAGDELPVGKGKGAKEGRTIAANLRRDAGQPGRIAHGAGPLLASHHRGRRPELLRRHLESGARGRSHRLSLQGRTAARIRAAQAAFRRRLRSLQHRRCLLSLWLDPGSGRHRADRAPSRCGVGRRLFHGRHGDLGRHGSDRPVAAAYAGEVRGGRPSRRRSRRGSDREVAARQSARLRSS